MCLASLYVSAGNAKMFCTSLQKNIKLNGRVYPGTGAFVDALQITLNNEHGSQLMTEPEVAGMPNPYVFDLIMDQHGLTQTEMCFLASSEKDLEMSEKTRITTCWIGKSKMLDIQPKRELVKYLLP